MLAGIDWANLHVATAFVLGIIVGGLAVARITRMVMDWLRREQHKD